MFLIYLNIQGYIPYILPIIYLFTFVRSISVSIKNYVTIYICVISKKLYVQEKR